MFKDVRIYNADIIQNKGNWSSHMEPNALIIRYVTSASLPQWSLRMARSFDNRTSTSNVPHCTWNYTQWMQCKAKLRRSRFSVVLNNNHNNHYVRIIIIVQYTYIIESCNMFQLLKCSFSQTFLSQTFFRICNEALKFGS